jgi:hypothetical protein
MQGRLEPVVRNTGRALVESVFPGGLAATSLAHDPTDA